MHMCLQSHRDAPCLHGPLPKGPLRQSRVTACIVHCTSSDNQYPPHWLDEDLYRKARLRSAVDDSKVRMEF